MQRDRKAMKDPEAVIELLKTAAVGRLGTIGRDGSPMIKPLNFVYDQGVIYFHTALDGEKIDDIRRDNRVVFEVDQPIAFVPAREDPCGAKYLYRSVILKGRAKLCGEPAEKRRALAALMAKYQPGGGYGDFPESKLALTGIVRIDVTEMTGKQDL